MCPVEKSKAPLNVGRKFGIILHVNVCLALNVLVSDETLMADNTLTQKLGLRLL